MNTTEKPITPEEMLDTLARVKRLYENSKKPYMRFWFLFGRKNGKTTFLAEFMKEYTTVITAYERATKRAKRARKQMRLKLFIRSLFRKKTATAQMKSDGLSFQYSFIDEQPLARCCRCGKPATETHRAQKITPQNTESQSGALPVEKFLIMCHECHIKEHERRF